MRESPESVRLRIYLLGTFGVSMGIRPIAATAWKRRHAATLLKILALTPSHRLHRERVLELLWPESDLPSARRNLHHTLHITRGILGPEGTTMELEQAVAYALAPHEPVAPPSHGTPDGRAASSLTGLSARKHEVALLVSQGLTNRQIAGTLTIAERTVDTHVSKILRKLQLTSRVHLARWVFEH